ncbi:hypothetical protein CONLIGDRAFT_684958 [Coniochaeta ligniaria NRRL 30616]|uniref:Uncharacterized protein n=1 Tax=Coniochaeta ligniaria NRRL 30616 TaxID=1408157 RepID=A0A1J7J7E6_9PEZI|nr:hypothetical protein CONLIGDRAFT_684958 [Coniochaeta ligniaria NRRL 30616]
MLDAPHPQLAQRGINLLKRFMAGNVDYLEHSTVPLASRHPADGHSGRNTAFAATTGCHSRHQSWNQQFRCTAYRSDRKLRHNRGDTKVDFGLVTKALYGSRPQSAKDLRWLRHRVAEFFTADKKEEILPMVFGPPLRQLTHKCRTIFDRAVRRIVQPKGNRWNPGRKS